MQKFILFLKTLYRFVKCNPLYMIIPACVLGAVAATAITVITVNYYRSHQNTVAELSDTSSLNSIVAEIPVSAPEETVTVEPQPVEKKIEYKGKIINVVKVEVAKKDSKEDAENGNYVAEKTQEKSTEPKQIKTIYYKKPQKDFKGGIDVSSHNGEIDWEKVKSAGVQFAMIRLGYRGYLTGKIVLDACFDYNIENAYNNGIAVGVYFYSTATNEDEALEEAAYVVDVIKKKQENGIKITYPVAYDFEEFYNNDERTRAKDLPASQISKNTDAYLGFIKSSGYKPMLYAGKNPAKKYWEASTRKKYDFWLAHYTEATEYDENFFMWQYTSSGAVDGIPGRVDLNICGFENNNNLPRTVVCKGENVNAYKKPDLQSEVFTTLNKDTEYLCRNTYDYEFLELKIDGVYCYVKAEDMNAMVFEKTENKYATKIEETLYREPYDSDEYKTTVIIPEETELDVIGIWDNKWAKIEYENKTYYIKVEDIYILNTPETSENEEIKEDEEKGNAAEESAAL